MKKKSLSFLIGPPKAAPPLVEEELSLVPIGRVEEVLYWLKRLEEENRIPVLPVYIDSPMAIGALQFYSSRLHELDADLSRVPTAPRPGARKVSAFATTRMTVVASPQQSSDRLDSAC